MSAMTTAQGATPLFALNAEPIHILLQNNVSAVKMYYCERLKNNV